MKSARILMAAICAVLTADIAFALTPRLDSLQLVGGSRFDTVKAAQGDAAGNVYLFGETTSPDFPATHRIGPGVPSENSPDLFVMKLRISDWSVIYSVLIGGTSDDHASALTVDAAGNAYLAGVTSSADFFVTPGAFRSSFPAGANGSFVAKLDPTGQTLIYSTYVASGNPGDYRLGLAVDSQGQAYLAGVTDRTFPTTPGALVSSIGSESPRGPFLAKLRADGSGLVFGTFLAAGYGMTPVTLALDGQQNIYVGGEQQDFGSNQGFVLFPATPGAYQTTSQGTTDAFVMKVRAAGNSVEFATLLGGVNGDSASFLALDAQGNVYVAGICNQGGGIATAPLFPVTTNPTGTSAVSSNGFLAKLSPGGDKLLFSALFDSSVLGLSLGVDQQPLVLFNGQIDFQGSSGRPAPSVSSARLRRISQDGSRVVDATDLNAVQGLRLAVAGDRAVVAGSSGQIDGPLPSTLTRIGPATQRSGYVLLAGLTLSADSDPMMDLDSGDIILRAPDSLTPFAPTTLTLTPAVPGTPFRAYLPPPGGCCTATESAYQASPLSGTAPARIAIQRNLSSTADPNAEVLVVASVGTRNPIQAVQVETSTPHSRILLTIPDLIAHTAGQIVTGTIQVTATATDPDTGETISVRSPFVIYMEPPIPGVTFSQLTGIAPAQITVTADTTGLAPGERLFWSFRAIGDQSDSGYSLLIGRDVENGPPSSNLTLTVQGAATTQTVVLPLASQTPAPFTISNLPPYLTVDHATGTAPDKVAFTLHPATFPDGGTTAVFQVQIGAVTYPVKLTIIHYPDPAPHVTLAGAAPGGVTALTIFPALSLPSLPATPVTTLGGYSFTLNGVTMPILGKLIDGSLKVQIPYGTPVGSASVQVISATSGAVQQNSVNIVSAAPNFVQRSQAGQGIVYKEDGTIVSQQNPVRTGDRLRIRLVGMGEVNPPTPTGTLPPPGTISSPMAPVEVFIDEKPAVVVSESLSFTDVGVVDVVFVAPRLAAGVQRLRVPSATGDLVGAVYYAATDSASLSPMSASIAATGGSGIFSVTAGTTPYLWGTAASESWLSVTSATGLGNGQVAYTVAPNPNPGSRSAQIVAAGQFFTVTQAGMAIAGTGLRWTPLTPCRLVDTRDGSGFTGAFGVPSMAANTTRDFPLPAGRCGVPATAQAYSLNVTVVPQGPLGFLSMWPAGQPQPNVSTLNSFDGRIVANAAIVPAGVNGAVSVLVTDKADLILDINGYFDTQSPQGLDFFPLSPCRAVDTRGTITGPFAGPTLNSGDTRSFTLPVACNAPALAQAYSMNVTVSPSGPLYYLTTWPAGQSQPTVSTLNSFEGVVVANAALTPAGAGGAVNIFASGKTDVILDVNGYFGPPSASTGLRFYPVTPCRIADTRLAPGAFGGPLLAGGETRNFPVADSACSIPATAQSYSLNVTVVPSGKLEYLALWPAGQGQPFVSTLNSFEGRILANAALVPAGTNGTISVYASSPTHVILDINGYFAP